MKRLTSFVLILSLLGAAGCVSRAPTIAHVHIGHAITGVHVTPNQEGYLVTAERRGGQAVEISRAAAGSTDLAVIKQNVSDSPVRAVGQKPPWIEIYGPSWFRSRPSRGRERRRY